MDFFFSQEEHNLLATYPFGAGGLVMALLPPSPCSSFPWHWTSFTLSWRAAETHPATCVEEQQHCSFIVTCLHSTSSVCVVFGNDDHLIRSHNDTVFFKCCEVKSRHTLINQGFDLGSMTENLDNKGLSKTHHYQMLVLCFALVNTTTSHRTHASGVQHNVQHSVDSHVTTRSSWQGHCIRKDLLVWSRFIAVNRHRLISSEISTQILFCDFANWMAMLRLPHRLPPSTTFIAPQLLYLCCDLSEYNTKTWCNWNRVRTPPLLLSQRSMWEGTSCNFLETRREWTVHSQIDPWKWRKPENRPRSLHLCVEESSPICVSLFNFFTSSIISPSWISSSSSPWYSSPPPFRWPCLVHLCTSAHFEESSWTFFSVWATCHLFHVSSSTSSRSSDSPHQFLAHKCRHKEFQSFGQNVTHFILNRLLRFGDFRETSMVFKFLHLEFLRRSRNFLLVLLDFGNSVHGSGIFRIVLDFLLLCRWFFLRFNRLLFNNVVLGCFFAGDFFSVSFCSNVILILLVTGINDFALSLFLHETLSIFSTFSGSAHRHPSSPPFSIRAWKRKTIELLPSDFSSRNLHRTFLLLLLFRRRRFTHFRLYFLLWRQFLERSRASFSIFLLLLLLLRLLLLGTTSLVLQFITLDRLIDHDVELLHSSLSLSLNQSNLKKNLNLNSHAKLFFDFWEASCVSDEMVFFLMTHSTKKSINFLIDDNNSLQQN